jgi:PKD repeat protein
VNDYFAKFSRSWDDYAGQDQQLKFWLDPDNTGDTAINGYDPWYGNNLPVANFNAVPTVIMAGGSVDFSDLSVGNVTSWSWSFPGAETTGSGLQYPSGITYNTPGAYEVSLTVSNGYGSDTELKTSYILVAEGCEKKSNIGQSESLALYSFSGGEWGYWSGHNQHIFTEFAERYNNLPGHFVHGIYILPGKAYNASVNSKITIKIWEGGALPGNEIYSKDILISQLNAGVSTYIPFVPTVGTSGSFYAGYQVYYNLADTFATLHAEPRGAGGLNTYYVKMDNTWHPVIDFSQTFTTSLSVEPKVCGLEEINSTNNTNHVIIFPNPSDGIFNINIGDDIRVINNVQVYNILGKIVANIGKDDINSGLVKVELNNPAEGIYLVRIPFENGIVEKKILIIR